MILGFVWRRFFLVCRGIFDSLGSVGGDENGFYVALDGITVYSNT